MSNRTAHVALFDTFNDSEVGLLLVDLRTGRFTGEPFDVVAIGEARNPITTMGGVRMLPDAALAELDPSESDVLILAGGEMWDAGGGAVFVDAANASWGPRSRWPRSAARPPASPAAGYLTTVDTRAPPPSISL